MAHARQAAHASSMIMHLEIIRHTASNSVQKTKHVQELRPASIRCQSHARTPSVNAKPHHTVYGWWKKMPSSTCNDIPAAQIWLKNLFKNCGKEMLIVLAIYHLELIRLWFQMIAILC